MSEITSVEPQPHTRDLSGTSQTLRHATETQALLERLCPRGTEVVVELDEPPC